MASFTDDQYQYQQEHFFHCTVLKCLAYQFKNMYAVRGSTSEIHIIMLGRFNFLPRTQCSTYNYFVGQTTIMISLNFLMYCVHNIY